MEAEAHTMLRREANADAGGVMKMVSTVDRPGKAVALGAYSGAGTYADGFEDKLGKRLPEAGLYAGAGVGYARAEWSVFDAEAKGPNASAGVGVSVLGAKAFAKAEVASASASAGPVKATIGLAADTGVSISPTNIEAKVLGTGFTFGNRIGFSFLGSGFEFDLF